MWRILLSATAGLLLLMLENTPSGLSQNICAWGVIPNCQYVVTSELIAALLQGALIFLLILPACQWGIRRIITASEAAIIESNDELEAEYPQVSPSNAKISWFSIDIVIDRIVECAKWEPRSNGSAEILAERELREAALNQDVAIYGRKELNPTGGFGDRFSDVWEPIENTYWRTHEIDLTVVLDETVRVPTAETMSKNSNGTTHVSELAYTGLRISEADLDRKWPKATASS